MEAFSRRPLEIAALFDTVSDPVWICDPVSLTIQGANRAAVGTFDYDPELSVAMSIPDIILSGDLAGLRMAVKDFPQRSPEAKDSWRIRCRGGEVLEARVYWRLHGTDSAEMLVVSIRDISPIGAGKENRSSSQQESPLWDTETSTDFFRALFEAAPGRFLVLNPGSYRIVAVSNAYLQATMTEREAILGKPLFEVFPDDPNDPEVDGTRHLRASLSRVEASGLTDVMAVLRYPIPRPASRGGGFEERFWSPVNTPVNGPDGKIELIIHRVEDVTDFVRETGEEPALSALEDRASHLRQDIALRSRELRTAYEQLVEQTSYLRAAQRLMGLGVWKMDLDTRQLTWLDGVHRIYGVDTSFQVGDMEGYLTLVHPADREALVRHLEEWLADPGDHFEFRHRILRPDGDIIYVKGLAELAEVEGRRQLTGVVQDVTDQEVTAAALSRGQSLSRIAGKAASLGGWRVDLKEGTVEWSEETASIHEIDGVPPRYPVEEGIEFYAPEYRDTISRVFNRCVETGTPFDEILQIITARGNRRWVRSIGEAERNSAGEIVAVQGGFQDITEQIGARRAYEELTQRLHLTLENMRDPFILLDEALRFVFANPAAEKVLEKPREAMIGKPLDVVFPFEDTPHFQRHYLRALARQESEHFTAHFQPLNALFRVDAHPVPDGLAVYFSDISREHEREKQLRLLEVAVSRQSDMLLITEATPIEGPEGPRIVYVNEAFTRLTGYNRDEVIGATPRLLQGPDTDRAALDRIKVALHRAEPVREELVNYTKGGEPYWLELDIVPLTDDAGHPTHFVSVERDITERKRLEESTRLSEERFHLVARATNDVIWDWDLVQSKVWWNESIETLFGHDRSRLELGPESWAHRIHPADKEAVLAGIHAVIEGEASNWSDEYRFLHADGSSRTVIDRGFVLRDSDGQAVRMMGSMQDITQQRQVAEELRQVQKLEAVGQLTGGVAHDFNNLLTVILGNAELLAEELTATPQLRALADMTASAASRGAELTNRLLAFARRQALEPQVLNVNRLVAGMEELIRRTLLESIEIELVQAGGLWSVDLDAGQLESAILNLALNARDAMPGGGRLTIETANAMLDDSYADNHREVKAGQYVLISLSDSGTGMSEDVARQAFEPFFTTKKDGKGSGLGLSMVYGFVKQSAGHIKIYSETGEGTTVKLYFPRARAGAAMAVDATTSSLVEGGDEHILVVEDDAPVRRHVATLLQGLGYRVTSAGSGQHALAIIEAQADIDLLFTDVVMPGGINGRQLADRASVLRPRLKILFTSGYTENAIVHHGRLDPGVQLLSKPYRRQELAAKVRKVLSEVE
ncbi:PAS domain S-box protein [Halomonas sp. LBP4]|uniref:PAS domain S-box protein n=1 Tax=Halomonas sp. LBP4 TaxID=2044917 RepID=UPI0015E8949C|nr:PAS domain S-box protein [Halomonas sp. LBP4]